MGRSPPRSAAHSASGAAIRRKAAARRLEAIVARTGRLLPKDYWPNLEFLSNWMGGTMRAYLRGYPEYFGETPVRDVGLIASEGRMTIPIEDGTPAGILDIRHHYFEFIPEEQADSSAPETVEAADLIEGRNYFIVLTTAGGLYRYNIHDLVRCTGFHGQAPILEFLNKGAHFSSLTGEKLSEHQVIAAVQAAQQAIGLRLGSYLLLPAWGDPPSYSLLVEASRPAGRRGRPTWPSRWTSSSGSRTSSTPASGKPSDSAQSAPSDCRTAPGPNSRNDGWRGAGGPSNSINNPT